MSYAELRAHSAFSFGDGATSPEALVARAAEQGHAALGLTDHADVGGLIRFTLEAEKAGIRPVAGAELEVEGFPLALLARDAEGYRNIAALVTRARIGQVARWGGGDARPDPKQIGAGDSLVGRRLWNERGVQLDRKYAVPLPPRGRAALTWADLEAHSEGVYCLTGPAAGELPTLIRSERRAGAAFVLDRWRALFGERLAVEVQLHHAGGHEGALATALIELAERAGVRWVVTNDPRYLDGGGRLVHDLLTANRADVDVNTAASWGLLLPNGEWRLKSPREMALLWQGRERGLEAAREIALDCARLRTVPARLAQ